MFELVDTYSESAVIKVIGVGGGGGNAVMHMAHSNIDGVEFICANTDSQALKNTDVRTVLQLGNDITQGWGRGQPVVGARRLEARTVIAKPFGAADMLFITEPMGGATARSAPLVAENRQDWVSTVGRGDQAVPL